MKISTRIWIVVAIILSIAALAIKLYFLPEIERLTRLTVKEQIQQEMQSFEKVLAVVATAANKDMDVVRRSFKAISEEKDIPIELRRAKILDEQFGRQKEGYAENDFESQALSSGEPSFRENNGQIEYAYPLKTQKLCQGCHVDASGKLIALDVPLGLAVRKLSLSTLSKSPIHYMTLDLFWESFALLALCVLGVLLPVWYWVLRPLHYFSEQSEQIVLQRDMAADDEEIPELPQKSKEAPEWQSIGRIIDDAREKP